MTRLRLALTASLVPLFFGGCRYRYDEHAFVSVGANSNPSGGAGSPSAAGSGGAGGSTAPQSGGAAGSDQGGQGGAESPPCVDLDSYPGGGIYKADISEVSGMTLNGFAESTAGVLRLKPAMDSGGSAYFDMPFALDAATSVFAHFSLQISGGDEAAGADGMAFVMQTMGPTALGIQGGGLGYDGIVPSVAIEFDTFERTNVDPDGNHIGLTQNGVEFHLATVSPTFDLNDGVRRYVWVAFDGELDLLEVFISDTPTRPATPILTYADFEPSSVLLGPTYLGFSASSGNLHNNHDLLGEAWVLTSALGRCR